MFDYMSHKQVYYFFIWILAAEEQGHEQEQEQRQEQEQEQGQEQEQENSEDGSIFCDRRSISLKGELTTSEY